MLYLHIVLAEATLAEIKVARCAPILLPAPGLTGGAGGLQHTASSQMSAVTGPAAVSVLHQLQGVRVLVGHTGSQSGGRLKTHI